MNIRHLYFLIWIAAVTGLCWMAAFHNFHLPMVMLLIAPYILRLSRREELVEELNTKVPLCSWCMVLLVALIGSFIVSAFMGWTKLTNDWFFASGLQPYVALLMWALFILQGHLILFKPAALENA
jgi:hypothetical protein